METEYVIRDDQPLPAPGAVITTSLTRERSYSVHVLPGEPAALDTLAAEIGGRPVRLVTDRTVGSLHGERIQAGLASRGVPVRSRQIPAGEQSKSLPTACGLLDWLAQTDTGRRDVLLAVGGGVVVDTVGWVASAYMRGIPYINAAHHAARPGRCRDRRQGRASTTRSRRTSSVPFYEPQAVVSCVGWLATLDSRQVRSGLAEVIKKAVIASPQLFDFIEQQLATSLRRTRGVPAIAGPCRVRDQVRAGGARPLRDRPAPHAQLRAHGGHAVETVTGYGPVLHGEAVAFGMAVAIRMAGARGRARRADRGPHPRLLRRRRAAAVARAARRRAGRGRRRQPRSPRSGRSGRAACASCCRPGSAAPSSPTTSTEDEIRAALQDSVMSGDRIVTQPPRPLYGIDSGGSTRRSARVQR